MGSSVSIPQEKHIVIVGGGYGGVELALKLSQKHANFTLIDVKDHFFHNIGAVRSTSEKGFVKKLFYPYKTAFGEQFKQGKAVNIDVESKKVILEGGESVSYDVVVIATGSSGDLPFKMGIDKQREEVEALCESTYDKLQTATNVVVIGGGAVGTETAAEIATDYKDKRVTLIHSSDKLLGPEGFTPQFQKSLQDKLKNKGVSLILGEKVQNLPSEAVSGPTDLTTDKGTSIQADLVYKCIGLKINTAAYAQSLGGVMEANGQLKVNQHFQVEGYQDVFAIGDCTYTKELKVAFRAMDHAKCLLQVLGEHLIDRPIKKAYDPASNGFLMAVSLGRDAGMGQKVSGGQIPGFLIKMLKSKDLTTSKQAKAMKHKLPK